MSIILFAVLNSTLIVPTSIQTHLRVGTLKYAPIQSQCSQHTVMYNPIHRLPLSTVAFTKLAYFTLAGTKCAHTCTYVARYPVRIRTHIHTRGHILTVALVHDTSWHNFIVKDYYVERMYCMIGKCDHVYTSALSS